MKNKKLKIILSSLIVLAILIGGMLFIKSAQAYTFGSGKYGVTINKPDGAFAEGGQGIDNVINTVFNVIITIAEVAFVLLFLIGGIMYLTSMGEEENSKKAKKLITDAVVGLVIVLAAWAIGTWVIDQLTGKGEGTGITTPAGIDMPPPPDQGLPPVSK